MRGPIFPRPLRSSSIIVRPERELELVVWVWAWIEMESRREIRFRVSPLLMVWKKSVKWNFLSFMAFIPRSKSLGVS